jgi:hypothetical protein
MNKYIDINNVQVDAGDHVKLLRVSDGLLDGLPKIDQKAILEQINKKLVVESLDEHNYVELEFKGSDGHIHSIWVDPKDVEKT